MSTECYFCGKEVVEDDFCSGCDAHVCDECALMDPIGPHNPSDHQNVEEELEEVEDDG